jgi:hypothetical protein
MTCQYRFPQSANAAAFLRSSNKRLQDPHRGTAATKDQVFIADCRLSTEEVVWQLPPLSIGNRQSKIGNSPESSIFSAERRIIISGGHFP